MISVHFRKEEDLQLPAFEDVPSVTRQTIPDQRLAMYVNPLLLKGLHIFDNPYMARFCSPRACVGVPVPASGAVCAGRRPRGEKAPNRLVAAGRRQIRSRS